MASTIGVIGCGKMAYAILSGLRSQSISIDSILVNDINQESINLFIRDFGAIFKESKNLIEASDIIILAVKPQQITEVITNNRNYFRQNHIVISLAAGITISTIENLLACHCAVIRAMPNMPALVGQGVTAISGGLHAQAEEMDFAKELFDCVGYTYIVDENYIDAITAVAGSGPAYIFLIVEAFTNAGVLIGLDDKLAHDLVLNTIKGSIEMLEETNKHPAILRGEVCSPAGTTIAAVKALEEEGLRKAIFAAVEAAFLRAQELGGK